MPIVSGVLPTPPANRGFSGRLINSTFVTNHTVLGPILTAHLQIRNEFNLTKLVIVDGDTKITRNGLPALVDEGQKGELVGVTFDGNLESLPVTYLYSDEQARAVHVDVRGIVEALDRVYKAAPLLKELGVTPSQSGSRP